MHTWLVLSNSLNRANGTASLLPAAITSAAYDAANEQTQFGTATLTYDANGNLTNDGTNTYTWDARNRLVSISGGVTAGFQYDALGRRLSKTINGVTTQYLYDGNDIVQEFSGGAVTATYLRSLNIDEAFVRLTGSGEFYHTDALGSTFTLSNASGEAATSYAYEAFGKTEINGPSSNPNQYTGRVNDETGLYYYRTRYYSPVLSRFLQEDWIGLSGRDVNLYAYANNSPILLRDPTGLVAETPMDFAFILYDLYRLGVDGRKNLGENILALGGDILGAFTPGVTGLGLAVRGAGAGKRAALTAEQAANLARFEKNLPGNPSPTRIFDLPNGGKAFQADIPAKNIPGSYATYEKQVGAAGNTLTFSKTTYAPDGSIVHSKIYFQK